jgi:hypothetical protein
MLAFKQLLTFFRRAVPLKYDATQMSNESLDARS